ncbi:sucrose-6-phosphate hydrolase SacC (GH32 family) [Haloferula luteola]|uniref:Sucrose-6-phosphate hydrolase SacC (GH32 family) n=1 Tax=Haloferula luteola TaxID=595692 RepID=A0A840V499_9BACT|nr:glycoside hydrolase family 32 protein [Haloferula luteola]MBB5352812.1 sucrose-6-phosphate hydrolase SacC (GH32 family) [Haloferula luteola]
MHATRLALISGFLAVLLPVQGEDLLLGDFELPSYAPWTPQGEAFSAGPANSTEWSRLEIVGAVGHGIACSENAGAPTGTGTDAPQGRLTSPEFLIERSYIAFRIAGGDYERHCCFNLLVDGKVVKSATGRNSDELRAESWDVSAWSGKHARLEIVDEASGSWGHLLIDQVVQTDHPEAVPVVTVPVYQESLRPLFHFTARQWTMDRLEPGMRQEGWINDLNGMIHYQGEYHLFAQRWHKCWLHAISTDGVHWRELEPAFGEKILDAGRQSGHCVIDQANTSGLGKPGGEPPMVAFWTHADNLRHGISYSLDRGRSWQDYPGNPILEFPERDPKVFWHEASGHWVMVMYGSGQYHLFTSPDLLHWKNENHPIPDAFECPDFFPLQVDDRDEEKWVLIHADGRYSVGQFDGTRFIEETPRRLSDLGGESFYATQTFENPDSNDGRRIQMAWMRWVHEPKLFPEMPFQQQISFPCELSLRSTQDGLRLFRRPIAEIAHLEGTPKTWSKRPLRIHEILPLADSGEAYRLQARWERLPEKACLDFRIRGASVRITPHTVKISDPLGLQPPVEAELLDEAQTLEILLDRRSIEVFVNDGALSCTRNFIPTEASLQIRVEGAPSMLDSVRLSPLKSIWPSPMPAKNSAEPVDSAPGF